MINRQRMMLDVDSEGFPTQYDEVPHPPATLGTLNVGRHADHGMVQALLADHKCLKCEPGQFPTAEAVAARYEGCWVDNEGHVRIAMAPPVDLRQCTWVEEARQIVQAADLTMMANHDGITRLSDSHAPDAYFGWK